jgi:hypothetical protein
MKSIWSSDQLLFYPSLLQLSTRHILYPTHHYHYPPPLPVTAFCCMRYRTFLYICPVKERERERGTDLTAQGGEDRKRRLLLHFFSFKLSRGQFFFPVSQNRVIRYKTRLRTNVFVKWDKHSEAVTFLSLKRPSFLLIAR